MIGAIVNTVSGAVGQIRGNRQMKKLEKNRPKYEIQSEYGDNQAMAKNAAFGRSRAAMSAEQNIRQNTANAIDAARQSSTSGAGTLAAVAAMNQQNNDAFRNLSAQEAQSQSAARGDLAAANTAMAEEKDKAWDFNVNQPYQNKVEQARNRIKRGQAQFDQGIASYEQMQMAALSAFTGGG